MSHYQSEFSLFFFYLATSLLYGSPALLSHSFFHLLIWWLCIAIKIFNNVAFLLLLLFDVIVGLVFKVMSLIGLHRGSTAVNQPNAKNGSNCIIKLNQY